MLYEVDVWSPHLMAVTQPKQINLAGTTKSFLLVLHSKCKKLESKNNNKKVSRTITHWKNKLSNITAIYNYDFGSLFTKKGYDYNIVLTHLEVGMQVWDHPTSGVQETLLHNAENMNYEYLKNDTECQ